MKKTILTALFVAQLASLEAETVQSKISGYLTIPIPAGPSVSRVGVPLLGEAIYQARVSTVTANTITAAGTPFVASQLAQAGSPYFVRFLSGEQEGRMLLITANTANQLTVNLADGNSQNTALDVAGWQVAAGDSFEIFPGDTLSSLFGTGADLVLEGGVDATAADTVGVWSASNNLTVFFYNTTLGYWVTGTSTANQNGRVLQPAEGMVITRRASRPATSLQVLGNVSECRFLSRHRSSASSRVFTTGFPIEMPLSTFGFAALNPLQSGTASTNADLVGVWNGTTVVNYFRHNDGRWLRAGDNVTDFSNLMIQPNQALTILRRAVVSDKGQFLGLAKPF